MEDYARHLTEEESSGVFVLNPRQREVLQLLAEAGAQKRSPPFCTRKMKSINTHQKQVMDKLDVCNMADFIKYAIRDGLTAL